MGLIIPRKGKSNVVSSLHSSPIVFIHFNNYYDMYEMELSNHLNIGLQAQLKYLYFKNEMECCY